jgi:hypothetical protein
LWSYHKGVLFKAGKVGEMLDVMYDTNAWPQRSRLQNCAVSLGTFKYSTTKVALEKRMAFNNLDPSSKYSTLVFSYFFGVFTG